MHDSAKFHLNRSNDGRSIVISRFFKMAAVRHLGCDFSYVLSIIFTLRAVNRVKMHHTDDSAKFHLNRSNHGRSIVISRFLKMAAVRHLGFL